MAVVQTDTFTVFKLSDGFKVEYKEQDQELLVVARTTKAVKTECLVESLNINDTIKSLLADVEEAVKVRFVHGTTDTTLEKLTVGYVSDDGTTKKAITNDDELTKFLKVEYEFDGECQAMSVGESLAATITVEEV